MSTSVLLEFSMASICFWLLSCFSDVEGSFENLEILNSLLLSVATGRSVVWHSPLCSCLGLVRSELILLSFDDLKTCGIVAPKRREENADHQLITLTRLKLGDNDDVQ